MEATQRYEVPKFSGTTVRPMDHDTDLDRRSNAKAAPRCRFDQVDRELVRCVLVVWGEVADDGDDNRGGDAQDDWQKRWCAIG